ncbi:SKA complex subunit 1 isoform X3 [Nelusetta ayraudi]|uniref:SKA complex subunit 1 isoform X3 n=1 Tax=Nelusetta ayraudi TaxID=303726 RepID=UPI003F71A6A3
MKMTELTDFSNHIYDQISSVKRMLDLSVAELSPNKMKKLREELDSLDRLMEDTEHFVCQQKEQLKHLKLLDDAFRQNLEDLQHMKDNIPAHLPTKKVVPRYMRGRLTQDQLNVVVQSFNTAIKAKYKILHQPVKSLNNHSRKLHQRFKEQETKDTKGHYFIVEDDVRELAQMKVDKRFQGILNMLRHCQRFREVRGGGITRFLLL